MKPPLIRRSQRSSLRDEHGVTIALVALSMVGILAMAVLSIDVVTLYLARSEAQRAADAAALAAARVISLSGVTTDPNNSLFGATTPPWSTICTIATQVALSVASRNAVGGIAPPSAGVTFKFLYNGTDFADCASPSGGFTVNPQVQVQVQRTNIPTFFSRIWNANTNTVTATAIAEVFNPSGSGGLPSGIVPVQPRCVKPWVVPNIDPANTTSANITFVTPATGAITTPGFWSGSAPSGVIGESFNLFNDCYSGPPASCPMSPSPQLDIPPKVNVPAGSHAYDGISSPTMPPGPFNLEYLPGQIPSNFTAVPSSPSCDNDTDYRKAVAGCDQTTVYKCGVASGYNVDVSNNPGGNIGDSAVATQCLIHQSPGGFSGQDTLNALSFPFTITAGTGSSLPTTVHGSVISSSNSIVSLPIFDSATPLSFTNNTAPVTVVGFLQVFINFVDANGNLNVTVLNVAGCGNGTSTPGAPVTGSSPVPVRLITPP